MMSTNTIPVFRKSLLAARKKMGAEVRASVNFPPEILEVIVDYCHWTESMVSAFKHLQHTLGKTGTEWNAEMHHTYIYILGSDEYSYPYKVGLWPVFRDRNNVYMPSGEDYDKVIDAIHKTEAILLESAK